MPSTTARLNNRKYASARTRLGPFLADFLVAIRNDGMILFGLENLVQSAASGMLLMAAATVSQGRQAHGERARTTIAAQG